MHKVWRKHIDMHKVSQYYRHTCTEVERKIDRNIDRKAQRWIETETDVHRDRQKHRQTCTDIDINTDRQAQGWTLL